LIEISIAPTDYILADLVASLEMMSTKVMPRTFKAFKMATAVMQYTWKSYAMGAPVPGGSGRIKRPTGAFAKSIKIRMLAPFHHEVYSDDPKAKFLEDGSKEYDMKKTHPYGKRSRVVKKTRKKKGSIVANEGDPYLIIPFRHGVPGSISYSPIPQLLYKAIRQMIKNDDMKLSSIAKGKKQSPNYEGELIPRRKYNWGSRLMGSSLDKLEGMVAMDVSTKKSVRTEYVTFRIISVNSPAHKWIQKARPGLHLTKHVVNNTKEIVEDNIGSGLKEDLGLA